MKKNVRFSLFSCVLITLFSNCSKSDNYISNDDSNDFKTRSLVYALGFDTTGVKIDGDRIIVENDIVLYKSKLSGTTPRQAAAFSGPLLIEDGQIKYFVPSNLSNADAIESAFYEYSQVGTTPTPPFGTSINIFSFVRVYSEAEANVVFKTYSSSNLNDYGFAEFPTLLSPLPAPNLPYNRLRTGKFISININAWNNIGFSQKKFLVAHEFGHAIGLRHTDWRKAEPESAYQNGVVIGAYTVPGTINTIANPDPNSVFNSGSGTTPFEWLGFTSFDKLAISYVAGGK